MGGNHHYAFDAVGRVVVAREHIDYRQQICGRLARACLCYGYEVAAIEHNSYGLFLNGCALGEVHCIKCIKYVVFKV